MKRPLWLAGWTVALAATALLALPIGATLGMHAAAQVWEKLGLREPYLYEAARLCAGLAGGAMVGLVQWLFLRGARHGARQGTPRGSGVRARWILLALGAGGLLGLANGLGLSGPGLAAAAVVVAALVSLAQRRLLEPRVPWWPLAQSAAVLLAALAWTVPWPPAALLPISIALLLAAGAITGLSLAS